MSERFEREYLLRPFCYPEQAELDTRSGLWTDRKRIWKRVARLDSGAGRAGGLAYNMPKYMKDGRPAARGTSGTSIFDPVLAEFCYQRYCIPGGIIVDPFAGGSVRGIVASMKGYTYWGCELREEQVAANRQQLCKANTGPHPPTWVCGDSYNEIPNAPMADFLFSCPPYGHLERYSKDPADLSNMKADAFLERYTQIIKRACARLRNNRYACFVVDNYRDKEGRLIPFQSHTIKAFERAGLVFCDSLVLVTPVGSAAMRIKPTFLRGQRKVVKVHQHVVICLKGDADKAEEAAAAAARRLASKPPLWARD